LVAGSGQLAVVRFSVPSAQIQHLGKRASADSTGTRVVPKKPSSKAADTTAILFLISHSIQK